MGALGKSRAGDRHPGGGAAWDGGGWPWGSQHEGSSVLWETTFAFQRVKPIVVSPFENPFPTRGCGPWSPTEGSGQSLVSPHAIDRPRCTDRQLLGVEGLLSSYYFLRTRQSFAFASGWDSGLEIPPIACKAGSVGMTVRASRRDSKVRQRWQNGRDTIKSRDRGVLPCLSSRASGTSRGISMLDALPPWWKGPCVALKRSYDDKRVSSPSSWRSVHRGR